MGIFSEQTRHRAACILTGALLEEQGFQIREEDSYLIAEKDSQKLCIYYAGRELGQNESSTMEISKENVEKLREKTSCLGADYEACLSYFVIRQTLKEMEICIVPASIIESTGQRGSVFSHSGGNYHYNYAKADSSLPDGALYRMAWTDGKLF